ncbi:hypothetical protein J1792_01260 [Streptomyces triculaminicus]|uniref:Uncharacterized protein n=1 Tax=Streptomyces triculaminicus TaxID=2816232 RepID=A0A939JLN4_9ACTN|nr:hypothetical protein [Streptomyces triculaminicus]MBO0651478.1 hypothetical protein [Streptomyces triculaminicus]
MTAEGEPDSRWSRTADVVLARPPARGETFREAAERVFREHPGCWLAAFAGEQANSCVAFTRDGGRTTARWTGAAPPDPVAVAASALYALPDGDRVVVTVAGLPCVLERPAG